MTPPRILVLDDQCGRDFEARRDYCTLLGLRDSTGDDPDPEQIREPIADAWFSSSQAIEIEGVCNRSDIGVGAVRQGWPFRDGSWWALVVLDLRFVSGALDAFGHASGREGDDDFGLSLLVELKLHYPRLPVVMLSSRERADVIERCRRLGAADFIQREELQTTDGMGPTLLGSKLHEYGLLEDRRGLILGRSLEILECLAAARRAATGRGNILLLGESGTGKELIARYVHDHSPKAAGPYRVFHPFGTAETLQEDLLFGHVRGAYTDARVERPGLFELANGGTLLIDEVADIPESVQSKLLRPIETRIVSRQGSPIDVPVDVQIVLATNKAVADYAASGRFREDLLNRIRAYTILVPPLRNRREDILLLATGLLEAICRQQSARWPRSIEPDAQAALLAHDWHEGNVRELRNVLERVVKDTKDSEIVVARDLALESDGEGATRRGKNAPGTTLRMWAGSRYEDLAASWPILSRTIQLQLAEYLAAACQVTVRRRPAGSVSEVNLAGAVGCLLGRRVSTVAAADFVNRLLSFDKETRTLALERNPILHSALAKAGRYRKRVRRQTRG
jgi:DNA-binding NtrC family response regulator